ncbi:MAG: type II toxin-antitoxin system VapC family toxin [Candidatus Hodarchaeales archaeon]
MAIFLDTSFIAAYLNTRDSKNKQASELWMDILKNKWGYPITSDYVVSECFTLLLSRRKNLSLMKELHSFIHGDTSRKIPGIIQFYKVTQKMYDQTWKVFERYNNPELSFTDLTIIEICKKFQIEYLASYDRDFKGKIILLPHQS